MITNHQADVLAHASSNGRYVTGAKDVIEMGRIGLLRDLGPHELAGGDHYLVMTPMGRMALMEWRAEQPKPTKAKRRSRQFDSWRNYVEACGRITFSEFLKSVWPNERIYR